MSEPLDQICNETGVSREEGLFYLEGYKWNLDAAIEACRTKTLPSVSVTPVRQCSPNKIFTEFTPMLIDTSEDNSSSAISSNYSPKKLGRSTNEIIDQFCGVALGASPEDARAYLCRFDWNLDHAVNCFFDERRSVKSYLPRKQEVNPSSAMALELIHGGSLPPLPSIAPLPSTPPLSSMRISPSVSQFQASQGFRNQDAFKGVKIGCSPSSTMDIDMNTTDDSLILVEDNVPVPDPAKENLRAKAIDCGSSSTEKTSDASLLTPVRMNLGPLFEQMHTTTTSTTTTTTTTITIVLGDENMTNVEIPFRSDQTVRDIRKAIEAMTNCSKDYSLLSATGVQYDDFTQTVARVVAGGSTVLYQISN